MGRKLEGRVERRGDKYIAKLRGKYIGTRNTEDEAQALLDATIQTLQREYRARSVRVLGEQFLNYLEMYEQKRRTVAGAYVVRKQLRPLWARYVAESTIALRLAEEVRPSEVQDLINGVVGRPAERFHRGINGYVLTGGTVGVWTGRRLKCLLHMFFEWTLEKDAPNPADRRIKMPAVERFVEQFDEDRIPHLHVDEIERLYGLKEDDFTVMHRTAYGFGIFAGLRLGEIAALKWSDIGNLYGDPANFEPTLTVRRSWNSDRPKTRRSQRTVPMLPHMVDLLIKYHRSLSQEQRESEWIFPSPETGGVRYYGWDPQWKDGVSKRRNHLLGFRTKAKIRKHIQFKHIRHTFATHLIKGTFTNGACVDEKIVSLYLGHTDLKMIRMHYASADVDLIRAQLVKAFGQGQVAE